MRCSSKGALVFLIGKLRGACHDPDEAAVWIADRGAAVVRREVDDEERGLERPEELDRPARVRFLVHHSGDGFHLLPWGVERLLVEDIANVDFSILARGVDVHGADIVLLHKPGDRADDIPIAHEAVEIDMGHGGQGRLAWAGGAGGEDEGEQCREELESCSHVGIFAFSWVLAPLF